MTLQQSPTSWLAWRDAAQAILRAMLGELEGLPVTGGEASVRLSPAGLDSGRWLAGFSPVGVSPQRLDGLPQRLGMPADDDHWFVSNWRHARQVGLAVEQTGEQVVAKVYLEYRLPAPEKIALPPDQRRVALQIQSCKWRCDGAQEAAALSGRTEYWRLSGVDGAAVVQLLRESESLPAGLQSAYGALADSLQWALRRAPDWQDARLLVVRDEASPRQGVAVRFYGSGLKVADLLSCLAPVDAAWDLNLKDHPDLTRSRAEQDLGWLHAGLDRRTLPFLTFYGAISSAQVRAVLTSSTVTASERMPLASESTT